MPQLQQFLDAGHIHPAHLAGVAKINTIQHTHRLGGHIITPTHPNTGIVHRRIHQPHGKVAFQVSSQATDGLHHHAKVLLRCNPQPFGKRRFHPGAIQPRLDLRAGTEGNDQPHAKAAQQRDVMDDVDKIPVFNRIPRYGQHHRTPAVGVDVRG